MISYAQNHEDVLLERCFKGSTEGFFIDVGAWEPVDQSVTNHFSSRGWRGINVEPVPEYFARLQAARPRDINLQCALGAHTGTRSLTVIENSGLSTMGPMHQTFLDELGQVGYENRVIEVVETTLAEVCATHVPKGVTIDFLKVDVEGSEGEVLRGGDWEHFRPRVLVVEAMVPVGIDAESGWPIVEQHIDDWQPMLLENGYLFAANDGLNCFYVRKEESELLSHFALPVNVFDDYVPYAVQAAEENLSQARVDIDAIERANKVLEHELGGLADQLEASVRSVEALKVALAQSEGQRAAMVASHSWRLTAPIRAVADRLRRRPT